MNHNMGTHPIVSDTTQGSSNHAVQSSGITSITNQQAYLTFQAAADSYNGQYPVFTKPSYMPHLTDESHLYDAQCVGMYGLQSPPNQSPSPPPPPRVYKPCVVCNDKSSGYHYGVSSCEGCKGFFRRSVQKNMQYTCHKDKNCPINKVTRNRCQYCRLQKCFATGMSKEAVRNDRNKKRKPKPESTSSPSEDLTRDDQSLIQDVLNAHRTTVMPESEKTPATPPVTPGKDGEDGPISWERIGELSSEGIVKIVDFAKKIPAFSTLSQSDQITLLKASCLEIMILRLSARYDVDSNAMLFGNGVSLDHDQLQHGGFGTLTGTIFNFAASLKAMSIDETEFAILSAICLVSGDRSGLQDPEKIDQMQEPLLEALKHYTRSRHHDQTHVFAKLLMKLTDLRSISVKGEKRFEFVLDHLANALSRLEAPASASSSSSSIDSQIKTEPADEACCSSDLSAYVPISASTVLKSFPYQGTVNMGSNNLPLSYLTAGTDYLGSQLPSPGMVSLPDSSIPSPLGLGMPSVPLSPMASMVTLSPSDVAAFTADSSVGLPSYLTGLCPTLSPSFSFANSSSMVQSPIMSSSADKNILSGLNIPDRLQQSLLNTQNQQIGPNFELHPSLNVDEVEAILNSSTLFDSPQLTASLTTSLSDIDRMKMSYNGNRNILGNTNLPLMSMPPSNGAQYNFPDGVMRQGNLEHTTPLSKIIAGAMTDTMQS